MIFLILLLILFLFIALDIKWTKQKIADYYGICRKTLGKWMRLCIPNIDYNKWRKVRKISILELLCIVDIFGISEGSRAFTKGEIIEKSESDYLTVRENIALNYAKLGIHKTAYSCLDIFPPKLSLKMVEIMG